MSSCAPLRAKAADLVVAQRNADLAGQVGVREAVEVERLAPRPQRDLRLDGAEVVAHVGGPVVRRSERLDLGRQPSSTSKSGPRSSISIGSPAVGWPVSGTTSNSAPATLSRR